MKNISLFKFENSFTGRNFILEEFAENDIPLLFNWLRYAKIRAPKKERETELQTIEELIRAYDDKIGTLVTDKIEF